MQPQRNTLAILYHRRVWSYAAVIIGAIGLAMGVGQLIAKRKRRAPDSIDLGQLSDSWLAEQRGSRDRS